MIDRREVSKVFGKSQFAETLSTKVRYDKYKPTDVTNEAWVELLGRDVSNYQHLALTRGIAELFVHYTKEHQPELMTDEEGQTLILTADVHDWGEALTGDISYGDKKPEDDEVEKDAFGTVAARLFSDEPEKLTGLQEARDIALNHEGGKLNRMFHAIEVLGYFRTALRAAEVVQSSEPLPPELKEGLVWLTTDVFSNVSINAMSYGMDYQAVHASIVECSEQIDQAFALIFSNQQVFDNYDGDPKNPDKKAEKLKAVTTAYDNWLMYRAEANF